ncbi:hypothetical protein NKJ70_31025 [Mesorhizobium sp. M0092]
MLQQQLSGARPKQHSTPFNYLQLDCIETRQKTTPYSPELRGMKSHH